MFHVSVSEHGDNKSTVSHRNRWQTEADSFVIDDDFIKSKLKVTSAKNTGILPPVVRYISPSGRNVLLERPPQVVTLNYYGVPKFSITEETTLQQVDIALPWTLYAFTLNEYNYPYEIHVYGMSKPCQNINQELYLLPVTNYESDGKFCPPTVDGGYVEFDTISEGINFGYQSIWSSTFNTDIDACPRIAYQSKRPRAIFDGKGDRKPVPLNAPPKTSNLLKRWEEFTLDEVVQWTDWPRPVDDMYTVAHLLHYISSIEEQMDAHKLYNDIRIMTQEAGLR